MRASRANARYLPGVVLPGSLALHCGSAAELVALADAPDLVIIATPMAGLRGTLHGLARLPCAGCVAVQGLRGPSSRARIGGLLGHEIRAQVAPGVDGGRPQRSEFCAGSGTGPAHRTGGGQRARAVRDALVAAFHSPTLRVYASEDIVGVEVGGAVKNVLAIATGLCDGLNLGLNARAALITRGLAEMTRLGRGAGRQGRDLHGPFRPGGSGAHGHG